MKPNEITALAQYLSMPLSNTAQVIEKHLTAYFAQPEEVGLTFEVVALYDKGFGPECLNMPNIKAATKDEAQTKAEEIATSVFCDKFGGKVGWEEIKIRPLIR